MKAFKDRAAAIDAEIRMGITYVRDEAGGFHSFEKRGQRPAVKTKSRAERTHRLGLLLTQHQHHQRLAHRSAPASRGPAHKVNSADW